MRINKMTYLRDIVRHIKGAVFKSKDYQNNGVAVVRVSDFEGESINLENLYYVSSEVAAQNKKVTLKTYDVVITTVGATAGNFIRVPKEANGFLLNQNTVRLRVKTEDESDQIYLFYALKNKNFKEYLLAGAQGSAQPSIVLDQILGAEIEYPDADIRKKIAKCLFDYDQKIQLNTKTNQTLEHIAQAIYKSWFVDYEPTRAKAAVLAAGGSMAEAETAAMTAISGKTAAELAALKQHDPARYQQLADLAAAFPAALVPTDDFGEIPEGWEVKYLKDVCNIVYGKGLPTSKLQEKGFPVFGGNGVIGYYKDYLYKEPKTLISCRGAASGKVIYSLPYSFVTNNSLVIENKGSGLESFYIYESLRLQNLADLASGSAQPQITISNMNPVRILIPSNKVCNFYSEKIKSIYEKMYEINKESELLSNLRDIILPKLLNGELKQE